MHWVPHIKLGFHMAKDLDIETYPYKQLISTSPTKMRIVLYVL